MAYPHAAAPPPWLGTPQAGALFGGLLAAPPSEAPPRAGLNFQLPEAAPGLRGCEAGPWERLCTHAWDAGASTLPRPGAAPRPREPADAGDALAACVSQLSLGPPAPDCSAHRANDTAPALAADAASSPRRARIAAFFQRLSEVDPARFQEATLAAQAEREGLRAQAENEAMTLRARWEEAFRAQRQREGLRCGSATSAPRLRRSSALGRPRAKPSWRLNSQLALTHGVRGCRRRLRRRRNQRQHYAERRCRRRHRPRLPLARHGRPRRRRPRRLLRRTGAQPA